MITLELVAIIVMTPDMSVYWSIPIVVSDLTYATLVQLL